MILFVTPISMIFKVSSQQQNHSNMPLLKRLDILNLMHSIISLFMINYCLIIAMK